jgi:hypothetical protein
MRLHADARAVGAAVRWTQKAAVAHERAEAEAGAVAAAARKAEKLKPGLAAKREAALGELEAARTSADADLVAALETVADDDARAALTVRCRWITSRRPYSHRVTDKIFNRDVVACCVK